MSSDRTVLRRSLLATAVDTLERNARLRDRLAIFEIGPVFHPKAEGELPAEPSRLAIAMSGLRQRPTWDQSAKTSLDFYDLKGVIEALMERLHITEGQGGVRYEPAQEACFHPGKCARVLAGEQVLGVFGELHPRVKEHYDFGAAPVLAADLDLDAIIAAVPWRYETAGVPVHPPVLEDIAVIVEESLPAARIEEVIRQAGGKLLVSARLFDIFRSAQIGEGKKSLAYSLTYQAPDRTLSDTDAAQIRQKIIRRLQQELGAKLRS
jgi:phenylalanyl-tRNA synthetase beta chain